MSSKNTKYIGCFLIRYKQAVDMFRSTGEECLSKVTANIRLLYVRWGNRITNFQLSTNDHRRTKAQ